MGVVKITEEEFDTEESKRPRALYWSRQMEQRVKNTPGLLQSECRQIIKAYCECMPYIFGYGEGLHTANRLNALLPSSFPDDYIQKTLSKAYQKPVPMKTLRAHTARALTIDDNLELMFTLQYLFEARNDNYQPDKVEELLTRINLKSVL